MTPANLKQQPLSAEELHKELVSASPLQASKILIQQELYDQQSSLAILDEVSAELSRDGGSQALMKPMLLALFDGVLEIKAVKRLGLHKTGVTPSRLVNDVYTFSYDESSNTGGVSDEVIAKQSLDEVNASGENSAKRIKYSQKDCNGKTVRSKIEDTSSLKTFKKEQMNGNLQTLSNIEVNDQGQRRVLTERSKDPGNSYRNIDVDHNVPLSAIYNEYGSSKALNHEDLKRASNQDINYDLISAKSNRSKKDSKWSEIKSEIGQIDRYKKELENPSLSPENRETIKKRLKVAQNYQEKYTEGTLENGVAKERKAVSSIETGLNKTVGSKLSGEIFEGVSDLKKMVTGNSSSKDIQKALKKHSEGLVGEASKNAAGQTVTQATTKGLGDLIILVLKPVAFELKDIFENGLIADTGCSSKLGAIGFRFKRAFAYVLANIKEIGSGAFAAAFKDFAKFLFNAIVDLFVGFFKRILKILVEGFNAIVNSFKVMFDKNKSPAEKGDAILKIIATTVVTFLSFAFEQQIGTVIKSIPLVGETLAEFSSVLLSSLGSVIVVWLIDQADFFSLKEEKRRQRVQEVFDMRIAQIKENTDIFESTALNRLAEDKLRFKAIAQKMASNIADNKDVNSDVSRMADFLKIELNTKSTDDFMRLLDSKNALVL